MGITIFLAIVALIAWFSYRGMQRQNGQFNASAPLTKIPNATVQQWQAQAAESETIESDPLYVNLQQSFRGDHDKIVQTLNDVADMLQKEVDARSFPNGQAANAKPADHETYRNLVSQQSTRLMVMFQDAEVGFEQASSPTGGTPEMLRQAYAAFLDQLIAAARTFSSTQAPPTYAKTQAAYRMFIKTFYEQIANWPKVVRGLENNVVGDSCDVVLSANYDVGPLQHAIRTESA